MPTETPVRRTATSPSRRAFFLYVDQGEELYVRAVERAAPPFLGNSIRRGSGEPRLRAHDEHAR